MHYWVHFLQACVGGVHFFPITEASTLSVYKCLYKFSIITDKQVINVSSFSTTWPI